MNYSIKRYTASIMVIMLLMMTFVFTETTDIRAASDVPAATGQVNASAGAYLRKSSSTSSAKLALLPDNTELVIIREIFKSKTSTAATNRWYYVKVNGKKGYIRADLVDHIKYNTVQGVIKSKVNCRKGAGTKMKLLKTMPKGTKVTVCLEAKPVSSTKGSSATWYKIKKGSKYYYVASSKVKITTPPAVPSGSSGGSDNSAAAGSAGTNSGTTGSGSGDSSGTGQIDFSRMTDEEFDAYLTSQGFPDSYKTKLKALHVLHPNWAFIGLDTGLDWNTVINKESARGVSAIAASQPTSYRSTAYGAFLAADVDQEATDASMVENPPVCDIEGYDETDPGTDVATPVTDENGEMIAYAETEGEYPDGYSLIEPGWYNASSRVIAYYMDPRNFLNEDRIYMFEDLSYRPEFQREVVVAKILVSTKLPGYGFTAPLFMAAGEAYGVSPVFLGARARQETGGGSIAISGYVYNGQTVYNPFNIGAVSGSDPVMNGIKYAYNKGWFTQELALKGGAQFLASGYINNRQNCIYLQKFNVANGLAKVATHQYMTNIQAPYSEAFSTKTAYTSYGIVNEPLTFIIPIFNNMPASTSLP